MKPRNGNGAKDRSSQFDLPGAYVDRVGMAPEGATPPSEPDVRFSRIRLSSQWVRSATIVRVHACSASRLTKPARANHAFDHR